MKLYGVRYKGDAELLAISDDLYIIKDYISPFVESGIQFEIGKIKSKNLTEQEIEDLMLVRVGLQFVPKKYTDVVELFTRENYRDLITTFNVLQGLYEQDGLNRSDKNSISQTLRILYSQIRNLKKDSLTPENMSELQNMMDQWKGKLTIDDQ